MKRIRCLSVVLISIVFLTESFLIPVQGYASAEQSDARAIAVYKQSPLVTSFFKNSYGYAVFPTVGKGGIGIGGAFGKGRVYRNGKVSGEVSLTQLSFGFQLGGQAYSEIIFFQDKGGLM